MRPRTTQRICLIVVPLALAAATPAFAQASGADPTTFLQNLFDMLNSGIARLLAALAVAALGIGWFFGHIDLRRAGGVGLGIIVTFSALWIVDTLTGGGG